jgi:protein O-mannosyl-transferase
VVSQRLIAIQAFARRNRVALAGAIALAIAVCALYLPFISNPLVFDDRGYFTGREFAQYASSPFGLRPRFPAAFSLAAVYVLFGTVEAQRIVGLLLHAAVTLALFWLIVVLQTGAAKRPAPAPNVVPAALVAAAFFGLHPVAVYGAAYLAQRSIVLATLFAVLSIACFARGLAVGRYSYLIGAAALYWLAVLSKEHAMIVALMAPAVAWTHGRSRGFAVKYTLAYVVACIPVSVFIYDQVRGMRQMDLIGQALEPQFADIASQLAVAAGDGPWHKPLVRSAVTQAGLFFRYLLDWIAPATSRMSFDTRVDLPQTWLPPVAIAATLGYLAVASLALTLVVRRGRLAVAGLGLAWFSALYLLEFSVVRFQEPFVLYRSYFWAPGLAVVLAVLLERVPPRALVAVALVLGGSLAWQAHDRLRTFQSGLALWEDAVAKLPAGPVPGAERQLYELGREYFYSGQREKAAEVVERCLAQYPRATTCAGARIAMLLESEQYREALPYLERALAERPNDGVLHHHLGLALERLGCREQARAQYEISAQLGFGFAVQRLKSLDQSGSGVLPPARTRVDVGFDCARAPKNGDETRR